MCQECETGPHAWQAQVQRARHALDKATFEKEGAVRTVVVMPEVSLITAYTVDEKPFGPQESRAMLDQHGHLGVSRGDNDKPLCLESFAAVMFDRWPSATLFALLPEADGRGLLYELTANIVSTQAVSA